MDNCEKKNYHFFIDFLKRFIFFLTFIVSVNFNTNEYVIELSTLWMELNILHFGMSYHRVDRSGPLLI